MLFRSVPLYYVVLILILFCCVVMGGPMLYPNSYARRPLTPSSFSSKGAGFRNKSKVQSELYRRSEKIVAPGSGAMQVCLFWTGGLIVCGCNHSINTKLLGSDLRLQTCDHGDLKRYTCHPVARHPLV